MLPRTLTILTIVISLVAPIRAQQQASVVLLPFGAMSESDRWIAAGLSRDLIEKMVRTPELRPVPETQVRSNLARILTKKSKGPAWLPASAQRKVGEWLDADLVLTGFVGASRNRDQARSFLDNLSIVPPNTPEGSEVWVAARLVDLRIGKTVSWAFVEGSRDGLFELHDALYLQMTADLGLDPGRMAPGTIGRPTESIYPYRRAVEAETLLRADAKPKKQSKLWKKALKEIRRALEQDSGFAKAHYLSGEILKRQGHFDRALTAFGQASALDPNYVAPRLAIAKMALRSKDTHSELNALQSALEAAPWNADAYLQMAQAYERTGRLNLATTNYDQAIRLYDRDPERLFRTGTAHVNLGQYAQAISSLERAVARIPGRHDYHVNLIRAYAHADRNDLAQQAVDTAVQVGAESTDLWLVAGELALGMKDYAAAEAAFLRVLAEEPERVDARLMVAKLRLHRGEYQSAIEAYVSALENGTPIEDIVGPLTAAYIGVGQIDKASELYKTALAKRPGELTWLLARARLLLQSLKHGEAIPLLRTALASHPEITEVVELIAGAYEAVGNDIEAIRYYRTLLRMAPDKTHAHVRLGDLTYRARQFQGSASAYRMAIEGGLGSADVYAGLGLAEEELSRYRSARSAYLKAVERERNHEIARAGLARMRMHIKPPRREPSASDWAQRGRDARDNGNLEDAIKDFERSISKAGGDPDVWSDLGTLYAMVEDTDRARTAFENVERLNPTPESAYNLGRLSFQEGKASEAKLNYQIALQRDESFLTAAQNLAALQSGAGDTRSAIKTLQNIRRHHAEDAALTVNLANMHFQSGDLDQAEELYHEAKSKNTRSSATLGIGNVALTRGDTSMAVAMYREAITTNPDDPDAHVNLGTVWIQQGKYEEAVEAFRKALELSPSDLALYLNLSILYYHTEQYVEALEYCRAILEQDSTMLEAQRLIGDIAIATSELDLAVEAYSSALRLGGDDPASLLGIAEALNGLGRTEEAREHWRTWLDVVGEDPAYKAQIQTITKRLESSS